MQKVLGNVADGIVGPSTWFNMQKISGNAGQQSAVWWYGGRRATSNIVPKRNAGHRNTGQWVYTDGNSTWNPDIAMKRV